MPFVPHLRMTALGRLGSASGERFSFGLNLSKPGGLFKEQSGLEGLAYFQDTAEDVRAYFARVTTSINTAAVLETVKFAFIGADGKYTRDPIVIDVVDTPGASSGIPKPSQVALCVSLTTDTRGPGGKGRYYLPIPQYSPSSVDFSISVADQTAARDSAKQFLDGVGNQPGVDLADVRPYVMSTKGTQARVTGVRVGRILDTIRSRRTQLPENYGPVAPVV